MCIIVYIYIASYNYRVYIYIIIIYIYPLHMISHHIQCIYIFIMYTLDCSRSYTTSKRLLRGSKQNAKQAYSWSTSPSAVLCTWLTVIGNLVKYWWTISGHALILPGPNSQKLDGLFPIMDNQTANASQDSLGLELCSKIAQVQQ